MKRKRRIHTTKTVKMPKMWLILMSTTTKKLLSSRKTCFGARPQLQNLFLGSFIS